MFSNADREANAFSKTLTDDAELQMKRIQSGAANPKANGGAAMPSFGGGSTFHRQRWCGDGSHDA